MLLTSRVLVYFRLAPGQKCLGRTELLSQKQTDRERAMGEREAERLGTGYTLEKRLQ